MTLEIVRYQIGDTGAAFLAAADWLGLKELRLQWNDLGDAGAAALAAAR